MSETGRAGVLEGGLPEDAYALVDAARRGDKAAAWKAAGGLLSWLGDISHSLSPETARRLVWKGAAVNRWFDIAELVAGAVASRIDATAGQRRLHAQMLMERGFPAEALARDGRVPAPHLVHGRRLFAARPARGGALHRGERGRRRPSGGDDPLRLPAAAQAGL